MLEKYGHNDPKDSLGEKVYDMIGSGEFGYEEDRQEQDREIGGRHELDELVCIMRNE